MGLEQRDAARRLQPLFAVVVLWKGALGVGTISHECNHAAFRYIERRRLAYRRAVGVHGDAGTVVGAEELHCVVQDRLLRQLVTRLRAEGYYP